MTKIVGYAVVFDSPSEDMGGFTEVIDPHAFDGVMNARGLDVACLFNHESDNLLGRNKSRTLRLHVDSHGLHYECDVPNTNLGVDVYELVKRGDVTTSSFQFICKRDEWQMEANGRTMRRILEVGNLLDVSPVTFAAYPAEAIYFQGATMDPLPIIQKIENRLGIPVVTSNTAMLWHLLSKLQLKHAISGYGKVLREWPALRQ